MQTACSVSNAGHSLATELPHADDGLDPESPSPVLVSEPVALVPDVIPEETPIETPPMETPTEPEVVEPQPVDLIAPTPTMPAIVVIENPPTLSEPAPVVEPVQALEPEIDPTLAPEPEAPPALVVAVDELDLPPTSDPNEAEDEDADLLDDEIKDTDVISDVAEVSVEGKCHNKKKAVIFWYHKKNSKKKKSRMVDCKDGKFKYKIREKKKHLKHIDVQTAFY